MSIASFLALVAGLFSSSVHERRTPAPLQLPTRSFARVAVSEPAQSPDRLSAATRRRCLSTDDAPRPHRTYPLPVISRVPAPQQIPPLLSSVLLCRAISKQQQEINLISADPKKFTECLSKLDALEAKLTEEINFVDGKNVEVVLTSIKWCKDARRRILQAGIRKTLATPLPKRKR